MTPLWQTTDGQAKDAASQNDPFAEADRLEAYSLHKNLPKDKDNDEICKVNLFQVHIKLYSHTKETFKPTDRRTKLNYI